jgi:NADH-quinone oxidoreductase subunit M
VAFLAATGVVLSAAYALYLYRRIIFGKLEKESLKAMADLSMREKAILIPLVFFTVLFGIWPAPILDVTQASVDQLLQNVSDSLAMTGAAGNIALK